MSTAKKLDSIGLRITPEHKEIIRLAAECTGQDLTHYMISCALDKAKKDIIEHEGLQEILLGKKDFDKLTNELQNPKRPNEKLKAALRAHAKTVGE